MTTLNNKCSNCKERVVFEDLKNITGHDLCIKCLEDKIRAGEIKTFQQADYEKIVSLLDEAADGNELEHNTNQVRTINGDNKEQDLFLLQFGRDLTKLASQQKLTPVIGRKKEIEETILVLSRRFKTNPLLIGEPGVGKTAVIEGIADKIVKDDVPDSLKGKKIIEINISNLVAGTKFRGEFESRLKKIIEEVELHKNIILFLDEFHTIAGAGGAEGTIDAANILKPSLARGDIQVIGATTFDEYRMHIQKDGALSRRMITIQVSEPTIEESKEILEAILPVFEQHHKVKFDKDVVTKAVDYSKRYITEKFLPDKAIDLIDEAAAYTNLNKETKGTDKTQLIQEKTKIVNEKNKMILENDFNSAQEKLYKEKELEAKINELIIQEEKEAKLSSVVTVKHLQEVMEKKTGIPIKDNTDEDKKELKNLDSTLKQYIKGQDKAVELTAMSIRRSKLKLKDPNRPTGVFLFLGPTGVGKTELSKALAIELFGDKDAMIRIDMGEFQEKHSVSKLIGSPPGYVGHGDGGKLTNLLRQKPFSIVLFDEVEKAHPDVLDVMLQIFEDGIITDNRGKTVDAKNAVFILTSNAGSQLFSENNKTVGFGDTSSTLKGYDNLEKKVMDYIKKGSFFKPEFLNRLDSTIVFNALSEVAMKEIVELHVSNLKKRLSKEGYTLEFTGEAIDLLQKQGYKPEYGARETKRMVENVTNLLANKILETNKNKFKVIVKKEELYIQ